MNLFTINNSDIHPIDSLELFSLKTSPYSSKLNLTPHLKDIPHIITSQCANMVPVFIELSADLLTPVSVYLKLALRDKSKPDAESFLFESVAGGERIARYFIYH